MYGRRIKEQRKKMNLSLKEFGDKFNLAISTISGYENESRKPDIDQIRKFAEFFDVKVDYLLGVTDDPTPSNEEKLKNGGQAYYGGTKSYTEEEIMIAEAAIAAYRAAQKHKKEQ